MCACVCHTLAIATTLNCKHTHNCKMASNQSNLKPKWPNYRLTRSPTNGNAHTHTFRMTPFEVVKLWLPQCTQSSTFGETSRVWVVSIIYWLCNVYLLNARVDNNTNAMIGMLMWVDIVSATLCACLEPLLQATLHAIHQFHQRAWLNQLIKFLC